MVAVGGVDPVAPINRELSAKQREKLSFIWSVKETLRDHYKRHQYQDVILPFCVLRRLDCVLEPTKDAVVARAEQLGPEKWDAANDVLAHAAGQPFWNATRFTFSGLLADQHNIRRNVQAYVRGFSPNARDALVRFGLPNQIDKMAEAKILYLVVKQFAEIDLHPDVVSNLEMGYIYEELIRVTADLSNEEAGEHFTPREVIELMVNVLFAGDDQVNAPSKIFTVYDPACGTGGMLTVAEEHLRAINPTARLHLFGQEVQPESYAVCRTDMLLKGQDASRIVFGDSFTQDGHDGRRFDYMLANPPYGKDWKTIEKVIKREHAEQGFDGRFGAGLPATSDGQILFLQQMISKMRSVEDGGSRIAVVFNGSPLFSGDAGSGMSEIRRWIIEKDWLEAIIGLPDQLFYNTGISTYVWVVTNRKRPERRGKVQLIDARELYAKMRKSLGNKRNELTPAHIAEITALYEDFTEGDRSKILPNDAFGYRKVTVERPLRIRYEINDDTTARVRSGKVFAKLDVDHRALLETVLQKLSGTSAGSVEELEELLVPVALAAWIEMGSDDEPDDTGDLRWALDVTAAQAKGILADLAVPDPDGDPVTDKKGVVQPDPSLRDTELIPLDEDIDAFIEREVLPYAPDAWVDHDKTKIGYEIPFTRHFYRYVPPRPLAEIDAEIKASQQRILKLLAEVTK
ncbi:MAG TPA: class I SAM-dependent DNA methyltransferase [Acidimicrobiales bacterium]|nr:class I SAM-dependent DNA methyltransferase [Acidimicrobiales bacterium]